MLTISSTVRLLRYLDLPQIYSRHLTWNEAVAQPHTVCLTLLSRALYLSHGMDPGLGQTLLCLTLLSRALYLSQGMDPGLNHTLYASHCSAELCTSPMESGLSYTLSSVPLPCNGARAQPYTGVPHKAKLSSAHFPWDGIGRRYRALYRSHMMQPYNNASWSKAGLCTSPAAWSQGLCHSGLYRCHAWIQSSTIRQVS